MKHTKVSKMRGHELRLLRYSLGMSQIQLAAKLGYSGNTIARMEREDMAIPYVIEVAVSYLVHQKTCIAAPQH